MAWTRDFKFGVYVDHSKSQPTDDKLSLKGTWSRHVTQFNFLAPPPKISLEWLKLDFKFGVHVDHSKSQPTGNKLSLKGAWLLSRDLFNVLENKR